MTYAVQGALQKAVELAKANENQNIEIEAVLKAALEESESLFKSVLERANIDTEHLNNAYTNKLKNYPTVQGDNVQYGQYISPKANELFNSSESYMKSYEDEYISMEHIILAAMDVDDTTKQYVDNKKEIIVEIIKKIRGGNHVTTQNPEANYE